MDSKLCIVVLIIAFLLDTIKSPNVDPLRESITDEDQRAFIKCHMLLGDSAVDIYRMLQRIARSRALSHTTVYDLYNQFQAGNRTHTDRRSGPGAPRTQATEEKLNQLKILVHEQNDLTEDEMAIELQVSKGTIANMIKEIGAKKVSAKWIPHQLNLGNKQTRIDICEDHLRMYEASTDMLDRIIALDESYLRSYDPEDKQAAKRWCLPEQPA